MFFDCIKHVVYVAIHNIIIFNWKKQKARENIYCMILWHAYNAFGKKILANGLHNLQTDKN